MINTTYIDQKYIRYLSGRLKNFRDKGNGTFEFTHSCESQASRKRRGFFYKKGTGYNFFCHNCQESTKFFTFLKSEDPMLLKEYNMDIFKENMSNESRINTDEPITKTEKKEFVPMISPTGLISYADLPKDHPAWKYVLKRKLPESMYKDIFFCRDFYPWASQFNDSFERVTLKEPRLILPYRNRLGDLVGFTCRSYGKSDRKYIEIKLSDSSEMIFGVDRIDANSKIYCVEGPIDSMFLDNCVAVGGASYTGDFFNKYKQNIVVIPDNDWKRNIHVLHQISKLAHNGFKIALLPDSFKYKDINESVEKGGHTKEQLMEMVKSATKEGPSLILEIAFRRKC